jgi:hypothetical protein
MVHVYKCNVKATNGGKFVMLGFDDLGEAHAFVRELTNGTFSWSSRTCIRSGDVMIESPELEEIIETELGELDVTMRRQADQLMGRKKSAAARPPAAERPPPAATETLEAMCARNGGWDRRICRRLLRKSGEQKSGRWEWAGRDVTIIEQKLRQMLKALGQKT